MMQLAQLQASASAPQMPLSSPPGHPSRPSDGWSSGRFEANVQR